MSSVGEQFDWKIIEKPLVSPQQAEPAKTLRLAVLLSGSGSNLQALIDAIDRRELPGVEIALVVSNVASAYGIQRALNHHIPVIYLPWEKRSSVRNNVGTQFIAPPHTMPPHIAPDPPAPANNPIHNMSTSENKLTTLLQLFQVDLIVLAGWMRIFSAAFIEQFPRRIINLHPALLPDDGTGSTFTTSDGSVIPVFRGLHVVRQALEAGIKATGSTLHYVTPEVDAGPVLCRAEVAIEPGDIEESLHERIKLVEHRLIVEGVRKWSQ